MSKPDSFHKILDEICMDCEVLFTIPQIRFTNKRSDYLYLLHKSLIESEKNPAVKGLKQWEHLTFVWAKLRGVKCALHYNWIEIEEFKSLPSLLFRMICITIFKLLGGKIVWTIHNQKYDFRKFYRLNHWLRKWMAKKSNFIHVHCNSIISSVADELSVSESKFTVIQHPEFPAYLMPRTAAIQALNLRYNLSLKPTHQIYLMFGNINPHKQMIEVIRIFNELPDHKKLLIAGPVKKGCLRYFRALKKESRPGHDKVIILANFIPESVVPEFFNASDYCLFNYQSVLSSGGVELARSYQKQIIAPNKGCLSELANHEYVSLFENQNELLSYLRK